MATRPPADPAIASLLDALTFARRAFGAGSRQVEREALLALADGTEADAGRLGTFLGRDRATLNKALNWLHDKQLVARQSVDAGSGRTTDLYRATASGRRFALACRDEAMARVDRDDDYAAFYGAPHPRALTLTGHRPSPARMPLPVGQDAIETTALRLAACRKAAGLTQPQLAKRAGTSERTVQRMEDGHIDQPVQTLRRCARVLGMRLADLLGD